MVVAGLFGDILFHQPARGLEIQHEDLRLQQRGLHPLALAGDVALQQRRQYAHGAEQAGGEVGDGNADPHRAFARRAGDRHQPAHALGDLIETRPLVVGPILPEAGDAAIDDAGIDVAQAFVIDAEAGFDIRPEILDHHVGLGSQPLEHREALGVLQVQGHRPLVAVQVLEIGALAGAARLLTAGVVGQGIDLDDIGAPVGQLTDGRRSRANAGQVKHSEAGQGRRSARECHAESSGWELGEESGCTDREGAGQSPCNSSRKPGPLSCVVIQDRPTARNVTADLSVFAARRFGRVSSA